ncbi:MAG: hypothetical protein NW241_14310 [Bacteroidia bacterium]|nr:hypothetical protein [Bacteroidia bacterium]
MSGNRRDSTTSTTRHGVLAVRRVINPNNMFFLKRLLLNSSIFFFLRFLSIFLCMGVPPAGFCFWSRYPAFAGHIFLLLWIWGKEHLDSRILFPIGWSAFGLMLATMLYMAWFVNIFVVFPILFCIFFFIIRGRRYKASKQFAVIAGVFVVFFVLRELRILPFTYLFG